VTELEITIILGFIIGNLVLFLNRKKIRDYKNLIEPHKTITNVLLIYYSALLMSFIVLIISKIK